VSAQRLPPSQHLARDWPVVHYGPVPKPRPHLWDLRCFGALATGEQRRFTLAEFEELPRASVHADLHCVTGFSLPVSEWYGVTTAALLDAAPPAEDVTHVMVWAEFGYSANMSLAQFSAPTSILATHCNGDPLTPAHGWPLRMVTPSLYAWKSVKWVRAVEYLTEDRRGFWEERGYHNLADPWREQRYSHLEDAGDGPPLVGDPAADR
jgi:DMSO/TMAO reductase YedYZ molybdopterin-dependent catalytic subunit